MAHLMTRCAIILAVVMLAAFGPQAPAGADAGAGAPPPSVSVDSGSGTGIGVDAAALTSVVSHPLLMFSTLKRAVYVGKERDGDTHAPLAGIEQAVELLEPALVETRQHFRHALAN